MKTTSSFTIKIFAVLALIFSSALINNIAAQNLIINPGFTSGTTGWSTDCTIEIYTENVYGGVSSTNNVTEIDAERCFNQQVNVTAGSTYNLGYKASRRQGGTTPGTVGVNVTVTGVQSGTQYINVDRTYTNTSWAYTDEAFSFTLSPGSTDTQVNVKFSNYVTVGTYGTIIDDINLSTGSAGVLPLRFISFSGKIKNNSAVLNWSASNDDNTGKYFIVERSSNQEKYDSIGIVKALETVGTYSFNDNKIAGGANYYRIKAINANGVTSYSYIITLDNNSTTTAAKLYPNPATSNIALSVASQSNTIASVQIFNISGNLVQTKQVSLNEGSNVISLDITSLKSGSFFLKVSDSKALNFAQSFSKK